MAGQTLTQTEINAFIEKLQLYKYLCSAGSTKLGPLKSAPKVEADVATEDLVLYETGNDPQASILVKNNVRLTVEVEDVNAAIDLLAEFKKGDNILDDSKAQSINLVPITSDSNAKSITFPKAFLQPGFTPTFEEGNIPNSIKLVYLCYPNDAGMPFTYGA